MHEERSIPSRTPSASNARGDALDDLSLRESEERFRLAFEGALVGMALVALDGRFLRVNAALCRIVGYRADELVGMMFRDITHPDDVELDVALSDKLARGEIASCQLEKRYVRKDRSVADVMLRASLLRRTSGEPLYFLAQIDDITAQKRADAARVRNEEELRRSKDRLARAQRVARLGSWEWDLRTNEVLRSDELFILFALPAQAALPSARSMVPYVHPDDRERVEREVDAAVSTGHPYTVEHRIVRADGAERIVVQHAEPILEDGKPVRMVGTLFDITERRRAEAQREETLAWLRAVFEHSPVALLLVQGRAGDAVEANSRATGMIGRTVCRLSQLQDILRDASGAVVSEEELPGLCALAGEGVAGAEYVVHRPDGARVPVLVAAAPIDDPAGNVVGAVMALQDVSAIKELERLHAEWSSVVAHDLRQPLQTMSLYMQFLLRKPLDQTTRHAFERMRRACGRLNRMIGDLMDLSRLDARRLELCRCAVDLRELIRESLRRFMLEAPERGVDLRVRGKVLPVDADPDRVAQILENLLSNALKYSTPGTPIEIAVEGTDEAVAVSVTNEGEGIAASEIPLLFQRFQRTPAAKATKIKGVGLGLYITNELVQAHGGRLEVESTPGAKTTFRFTLPIRS
jgi:PAS domain S-box-containing protein